MVALETKRKGQNHEIFLEADATSLDNRIYILISMQVACNMGGDEGGEAGSSSDSYSENSNLKLGEWVW